MSNGRVETRRINIRETLIGYMDVPEDQLENVDEYIEANPDKFVVNKSEMVRED